MLRWTRDEMKQQAQRAGGRARASGSPLLPTHQAAATGGTTAPTDLSLALGALTAVWGHSSQACLSSLGWGTEGPSLLAGPQSPCATSHSPPSS